MLMSQLHGSSSPQETSITGRYPVQVGWLRRPRTMWSWKPLIMNSARHWRDCSATSPVPTGSSHSPWTLPAYIHANQTGSLQLVNQMMLGWPGDEWVAEKHTEKWTLRDWTKDYYSTRYQIPDTQPRPHIYGNSSLTNETYRFLSCQVHFLV